MNIILYLIRDDQSCEARSYKHKGEKKSKTPQLKLSAIYETSAHKLPRLVFGTLPQS